MTIRVRMDVPLSKSDWLGAARRALLRGGVGSVSIEKLARELGVTKGSFYWHFKDRAALLEALLKEWEDEADLLIGAIGAAGPLGVDKLMTQVRENVFASERGDAPSDAAIFAWAAVEPGITDRVNAAEQERIALLAALLGNQAKAEIAYMAYLGYILRRRHGPNPAEAFLLVSDLFRTLACQEGTKLERQSQGTVDTPEVGGR